MSDSDVRGVTQWQTWRVVSSDDTLLTDLRPANLPTDNRRISVHPFTAIAIRAFGKDTDNDDFEVRISGWMDSSKKNGAGPGQRLWRGDFMLGSENFGGASIQPLDDGKWGAAAIWFEVDTFNSAATSGYNAVDAVERLGGNTNMLIFPTLGYHFLVLEVDIDGGDGTAGTELGIMWKGISREGVV